MSGPMREERKVVTALFADVVGSTQLTERLDPEDAREILQTAVRRMVEAVEAFGGTVKDLAGDGILALFGAPVTHEDDAERAIRSALRIVSTAETATEDAVAIRIGIDTGLVVLGPIGGGGRVEYGATGDALNTAARLQAHASPGAVLVGDATRRAALDRFDWGEEQRLDLRGKAERVSAFEVLGERTAPRERTTSTPMVGREVELARASRIAARALTGDGGVLVAIGDPGIGKSRLLEELRDRTDATWLEGRCVSFGASTPYLPLRDVCSDALGLPKERPLSVTDVVERSEDLAPGELGDAVPYLAAVLGMQGDDALSLSPETRRLRTVDAMRRLVVATARRGPAVVAIEDLHWADASSIRALQRLVPACQSLPVLFVFSTRGGDGPDRRIASPSGTETIELLPLPDERIDDLATALLGDEDIPADLLARVVETSGGNPFFLSELLRSLAASGAIGAGAGDADPVVELPNTIEKVILARLDQLDPSTRDVLTAASVLGRSMALPLLERLAESDPRPAVDELVRVGLFERNGHADDVWFAHALIQEVAYGSLLRRRRRELHAAAAAAIQALWPDREEENLGVLAIHQLRAGDLDAAMRSHDRAADRADRLHASEEALEHRSASIEIATELGLTTADPEQAERLLARAHLRGRTGDTAGARRDLESLLGDPDVGRGLRMRADGEMGFVLAGAADYRAAVPHLEAALEEAIALGDAAGEVNALGRLSLVHANRLDFDAALDYGERALGSARRSGDQRAEAAAMDALKQTALETGDVEALETLADRLEEIHRRNDDLWLLQFPLLEVGYADLMRMRLDLAFERLEEAFSINRRIGDVGNESIYLAMLGRAHRATGDYDQALTLGRRAFDLARERGHEEWTAWSATWLGSTLLELFAFEEASSILSVGVEAAERSGADIHLVRCLGMDAWAKHRLGDPDAAAERAEAAISIIERIRVRPPRAYVAGQDAYVAVGRVRLEQGLPEAAESLVAPIVDACRNCGWSDGVVDGSLVLADAAQARDDPSVAVTFAAVAVAEAERTGLPTAWRAHRGAAQAFRAAGDEARGTEQDAEADRAFARVLDGLHDRALRDTFTSAALGGPS
jgi:class 3 adenylate cyclase/tetratricopeptide (TPR) repeat protein